MSDAFAIGTAVILLIAALRAARPGGRVIICMNGHHRWVFRGSCYYCERCGSRIAVVGKVGG